MESGGATVDPSASFIYFVYPFLYEAETFARRVQAVQQAQWQGRERPLTMWQAERFPEDDLLAHVARYLNPSKHTPPTAYHHTGRSVPLVGLGYRPRRQCAAWRDRLGAPTLVHTSA